MNQISPGLLLVLNCLLYPLLCWTPIVVIITLRVTGHLVLRSPISLQERIARQKAGAIPAMRGRDQTGVGYK